MATEDRLILLIEDSAEDVLFFKRTLSTALLGNPMQAVQSVDEAIGYLEGTGEYFDRSVFPLPSIVIVDLHLPNKDGFEFFRWLRGKPEFRNLHVVAVSGVGRLQEINRAYGLGANSFLTKPVKAEDLRNLARGFAAYWK